MTDCDSVPRSLIGLLFFKSPFHHIMVSEQLFSRIVQIINKATVLKTIKAAV